MSNLDDYDPSEIQGWRTVRGDGWYQDIGWALQDVLREHQYRYNRGKDKPDDPGWHVCSCGKWQGYWSGFDGHVANILRQVVTERFGASQRPVG